MGKNRFLIAPLDAGLHTELRPWLIPDKAFAQMRNMYVFRGRVRKRFGSEFITDPTDPLDPSVAQLGSRLRIQVGTVVGGNASGTVPTDRQGNVIAAIGQMFSIDTNMYTVWQANGDMLTTGGATTYTFNTATGAFSFTGAAEGEAVYWYPSTPVMGLIQREVSSINDEPTFAFDTSFAYQYVNGGWARIGANNAVSSWSGDSSNFFWGTNWRGVTSDISLLFVSNFNIGGGFTDSDPMRYWDGSTWTYFAPLVSSTNNRIVVNARIIVPFKDRLVLLNVVENVNSDFDPASPNTAVTVTGANTQFGNRCRFSQNGDPINQTNAFLETEAGRGGFIDAPTQEHIVSAEFLKDRLIVFFERSTWELVYTGNEILPFRWQQINTELGAESTFSIVPFDKVVLGIGDVGVHACNGANVERIDQNIPDTIFEIHNENDGPKRVYGIRDYYNELVYWAYPEDGDTFPTKVLVYNYTNGTWAQFDDSITCFGNYQYSNDRTWESLEMTWDEAEFTWGSAIFQSQFRSVLAGNQQGYTFVINNDLGRNSPALQITDINTATGELTVYDHNLKVGDFVAIENAQGVTFTTGIYEVGTVGNNVLTTTASFSGTYTGGGTLARVSRPELYTKQYNFFAQEGRNTEVTEIDFMVDKTTSGELSIDYFASASDLVLGTAILETSPYALYPFEQTQARLWHRAYVDVNGEVFQLRIYLSDEQMADTDIAWSDIEIHAILFHASSTDSRLQ